MIARQMVFSLAAALVTLIMSEISASPAVPLPAERSHPASSHAAPFRSAALPAGAADLAGRATYDPRVRQYIAPARILWQSNDPASSVQDAERLMHPGSGQISLADTAACVMTNRGAAPGILLDFGRELQGAVQIGVVDLNPGPNPEHGKTVRLHVRFGESAGEAMSTLGEKNSQTDHAIRDQVCRAPWLGTVEVGDTGFRFVRIDLLDPGTSISIRFVRAVFIYRDLPYLGSFRCSDERLNQIWMTGAYTVQLCMQDYLWDGIKRDRLVWIGDMHPETMTISAVFGDVEPVKKSLDLVRDETPLPHWMNGISSYSLWWVLIQQSWYLHYGDLHYLQQQEPYLTGLLTELMKHVSSSGEEILPEGRFLDWPSSDNRPAIHAGLQSLLVLTMEAGASMEEALGSAEMAARCRVVVSRLKAHTPDPNHSKQAAALMALAGLGSAQELNRTIMAVDGPRRLSTFYGYYVLQARAKAGDYQGCLDTIREYWGGMIDHGATTFWEDFDLDWTRDSGRIDELTPPGKKDLHGDFGAWCYLGFRHSLCHGWASGPTPWLTEHVLGIQVIAPGCKVIRIDPHLGDLKWAEGSFPTPLGVLHVRHDREADGRIKTTVHAPEGIKIEQAG